MRHLEHDEQVALFRLSSTRRFRGNLVRDYIYAVPNAGTSGGKRAMLAGVRRKAEGVSAGVPDVECMVAMAPYTGLHIEMKKHRKDGGKPSDVNDAQKEMMARLESCGRKCVVAFGCIEAWAALCEYLELSP